MNDLYTEAFQHLENSFRVFENMVPPPKKEWHGNTYYFRYEEQSIHQAMIQKLARVISGLHAASLLINNGFLQEQAALHRMLDEFHEDTLFLAYAVINDTVTETHRRYLAAFYKEEFDHLTGEWSPGRKKMMVQRREIRAYLDEVQQRDMDPNSRITLSNQAYSAYSGFIHGASPHIMDMVQGNPPKFRLHGMEGTSLYKLHQDDLFNPFFRAIISFAIVAKAFGNEDLFRRLHDYHLEFDKKSGRNNAYRPESN
jgi:hypothetical protein